MDVQFVTSQLTASMIEVNYAKGAFPMANHGRRDAITWHCPRRRAIIPLDGFHISRSLGRTLRQARFTVTFDTAFDAVMLACADRPDGDATWIDSRILAAYGDLHRQGKAHSVEVWSPEGSLVGGLYGVHFGAAFFAESKFHRARDMSKVALAHLVFRLRERGFLLLEVQYLTEHLAQFGALEIPHRRYLAELTSALGQTAMF